MTSSLSEVFQSFSCAVITGGSSGLGQSFIGLALKMHPAMRICNLSRTPPEKFSEEKGLRHITCDLADGAALEQAARQVETWLRVTPAGRVLLINNSGFGAYGPFPESNLSNQLKMIDVNVRAVVNLTGLLLPTLLQRGGAVVNIASTAAFQPTPYASTYGATKSFVLNWTLALNEELRGSTVHALAVCPGPTATNFFHSAGMGTGAVSPGLTMTGDEVITRGMLALGTGRSVVVTGWKNRLLTLGASLLPKPFVARIAAKVLARYRVGKVRQ